MPNTKRLTFKCVKKILDATNLVELVESKVVIEPVGDSYCGASPFRPGYVGYPCFHVFPKMRAWKCFESGYAGDAIRFLELTEGKTFNEAVEELAYRAKITPEYEEDQS